MVEFKITGNEFDPNMITNVLQIEPNECWEKGEQIRNKSINRSFSCWIIRTEYEESLDVNNQITSILRKIKDKKNQLIDLKEHKDLDYKIDIVIRIENNEKPAIYLNSDSIEFANSIKAEFEIDLYIYS
jgi:hypothetical protein